LLSFLTPDHALIIRTAAVAPLTPLINLHDVRSRLYILPCHCLSFELLRYINMQIPWMPRWCRLSASTVHTSWLYCAKKIIINK
jgi:hypothetical protein